MEEDWNDASYYILYVTTLECQIFHYFLVSWCPGHFYEAEMFDLCIRQWFYVTLVIGKHLTGITYRPVNSASLSFCISGKMGIQSEAKWRVAVTHTLRANLAALMVITYQRLR